eukprot:gene6453-6682_t
MSAGSQETPGSPSRRISMDTAPSWHSSADTSILSSRRASGHTGRASDSGGSSSLRNSVSLAQVPTAVKAAVALEGGIWESLAAGEGPLSKSHSLLTKHNMQQQDQAVGRSLECVAEDDREGRDSPAPGMQPSKDKPNPGLLAIMQPQPPAVRTAAASGKSVIGSPVASFCFPHHLAQDESSQALSRHQVTKVDPFDAVEPEPQTQFVEQMKQQDRDLKAARQSMAAQGMMRSLRRSISGAVRMSTTSSSSPRLTWNVTESAGPLASAAPQLLQAGHAMESLQELPRDPDCQAECSQSATEEQLVSAAVAAALQAGESQGAWQANTQPDSDALESVPTSSTFDRAAAASSEITPAEEDEYNKPQAKPPAAAAPPDGRNDDQQLAVEQTAAVATGRSHRPSTALKLSRAPSTAGDVASPVVCYSPQRPLPVMGQASMEILDRFSIASSGKHQAHKPLLTSSVSMRLTDVYQATSSTDSPLAAGLASIKRGTSSLASKQGPASILLSGGPNTMAAAKSVLGPPPQHPAYLPMPVGSPREVEKSRGGWDWQQLGLPTGPGAALADPTIDPATYPAGNKRNGTTGGLQVSPFLAQAAQSSSAGQKESPDQEQSHRLAMASKRPSSAGVPSPPAFLSRATSAQAAVSAQFNPHTSAAVGSGGHQAVKVPISPEPSSLAVEGQAEVRQLSPSCLASPYASPRQSEGSAGWSQSTFTSFPGSATMSRQSSSKLYQPGSARHVFPSPAQAPQDGSMMKRAAGMNAPKQAAHQLSGGQVEVRQQQSQHVITAVDLAKARAQTYRRTSSGSSTDYSAEAMPRSAGKGAKQAEPFTYSPATRFGGYVDSNYRRALRILST